MKRALSWLLAIALVVSLATPVMAADANQPFKDVNGNNRFYNAIMWASNEGIAAGYTDGNFGIGDTCTRGQMVVFLWRFAGQPEPSLEESPFEDVTVNNRTYGKAVLWAYENGITQGIGNNQFGLNNTCTRQQAVQFLYNYFGQPNVEGEENFSDVNESNRFYNAIVWAASMGVANGKANNVFDGSGFCQREHIVMFIYNARPGTKVNPIMVMPEDIPYTFEAEVPAGETVYYYGYRLNGMVLSVDGEEVEVLESMSFFDPVNFSVSNETEEDAVYSVTLGYPVGSQMNPEVVEFDIWTDVSLEANDIDGYYYSYTPVADGSIVLYIASITEGVVGDIIVTNMNTYAQKTLSADGIDNYGLELHMDVVAGEELIIQVLAQPDESWNIPAADITWSGTFSHPAGTEQNPVFVEFEWNEDWSEGTASVTVPAGETVYYACWNAGMILTINGEEWGTLTASGMGRVPAVFSITNDGAEDAEYALHVKYPVGEYMNPEVIEFDAWTDVSLEANDYDGYYYSYTPNADGSIVLYIYSITEGVVGDILVNNQTTYAQYSLSADGIDNYGLELHLDVVAGEELIIQVLVQPDENWNIPAADISWAGTFSYPAGTEQNPIFVDFVMNDEWTEGTATVTVPAGQTVYYASYNTGMILSINGEEWGILIASGMGRVPAVFSITNDGAEDAEYALSVQLPVGEMMNPEVIEFNVWENLSLEAGDFDGYFYSYTPEADGTIMLYISSITEGVVGDIIVNNQTTYAQYSLSADGIDNYGLELHLDVVAGEELIIQVLAQPDENWNIPAAELIWVGQFNYPEGTEQNPVFVNFDMNDEWSEGTSSVTVPAGQTIYYQCYNAGMILSINGEEWGILTADGMGFSPAVFSITNEGAEDAEYALHIKTPVGAMMNPEVIDLDYNGSVSFEANNFDGYYYSYTAVEDQTIEFSVSSITEGVDADIIVNNQTTYAQSSLAYDSVDGVLTVDVLAGEELVIQVVVMPDENWNYPAADISWTAEAVVVAPTDPVEIVEAAYALEDGASLPYTATLTGEITKINTAFSSSYNNISVTIVIEGAEDKPILCYRLTNNAEISLEYGVADLAVGDIITVTGNIKNYNGTIEFDTGCTLDAIVKGEGEVPVAPEDPAAIIDAAYALEEGASLPYSATLTGVITKVNSAYSSSFKNITVTIVVEGSEDQPIECYRMKGTGADVIAVGDTITVTGTLKNYYGKIEFDTGCSLDSYVKAEVEEPETSAAIPPVSAPEADTAYKFGLIQVNNGTTVYVTGEVSGRYLATTQDKAAAADVYAEAVEGGYKFYILVEGEKSYIQIYFNESNQISVQFAAEGSVYAYNAETCCWYTNVDGTDYYLGSFNTFETVSASKISYINADNAGVSQFPAGFFTAE